MGKCVGENLGKTSVFVPATFPQLSHRVCPWSVVSCNGQRTTDNGRYHCKKNRKPMQKYGSNTRGKTSVFSSPISAQCRHSGRDGRQNEVERNRGCPQMPADRNQHSYLFSVPHRRSSASICGSLLCGAHSGPTSRLAQCEVGKIMLDCQRSACAAGRVTGRLVPGRLIQK